MTHTVTQGATPVRWRKMGGGGKIGGSGNEENSARAAPKRGGGQGVGDTSLQCISF